MPANKIVIVEAPAKAQTINRYLGNEYKVLASYGHIRDLPSKNGSVNPEKDFGMIWETNPKSEKIIRDIVASVKGAKTLFLATDHDREGEAISWHIREVLEDKKALKDVEVKRIVFNEITKNAIQNAIKNPREIQQEVVDAYLVRRALDYLVGFSLSPVLWRKLPGARSAGRVQSVALRLIVDREREIEAFNKQEYWTIKALCLSSKKEKFSSRLIHLLGKKLEKFDLNSEILAKNGVDTVKNLDFFVKTIEKKQQKRNPTAPFITSTLQQEAARKLGFSASKTMMVAQRLYEGLKIGGDEVTGLITYMRTDSVHFSQDAINFSRDFIGKNFGDRYLPSQPRVYKNKSKNAQEAHEAIRPTDFSLTLDKLKNYLDNDQINLYDLIWKRALASQMESAIFDQVGVNIADQNNLNVFRANGSTLVFDGFLKLYQEGKDDPSDNDDESILPILKEGEKIDLEEIIPEQHFTQPPPRYTEATLVKKLEELGIGRPSTYAPLLSVLQDRDYAVLEKKQFVPTDKGRLVTSFLLHYFKKYVEYDFTAALEEKLDDISDGKLDWLKVMKEFWQPFIDNVYQTQSLKTSDVIDVVQEDMMAYLFPDPEKNRVCPKCIKGVLNLKPSRYGAFIGCDQYPDCDYTKKIANMAQDDEVVDTSIYEPKILGLDPNTNLEISLRKGPYGFYLQWGTEKDVAKTPTKTDKKDDAKKGKKTATKAKVEKPKRVSIPSSTDLNSINLDLALKFSRLPMKLGKDLEGKDVTVSIGRFGPYIQIGGVFCSIPKNKDMFALSLEEALALFAEKKGKATQVAQKSKSTGKASKKS